VEPVVSEEGIGYIELNPSVMGGDCPLGSPQAETAAITSTAVAVLAINRIVDGRTFTESSVRDAIPESSMDEESRKSSPERQGFRLQPIRTQSLQIYDLEKTSAMNTQM
jgi:hypothetical protein